MADNSCTIEWCERPLRYRTAGLCQMHYFRQMRGSDMNRPPSERNPSKACGIPGCPKLANGKHCSMHAARLRRHGDPNAKFAPIPRLGPDNPTWRGDDIGYGSAHDRVRRRYGSASYCLWCSSDGPYQWAYDWRNATKRLESELGPYSPNPDDYIALCIPCHKRYDLDRIELESDA